MSREILLLVDALAREKNVTREVVFSALESALASAMKKRFKEDADIRVTIDRATGAHEGYRRWLVVPDEAGLQEPDRQELFSDAQEIKPGIQKANTLKSLLSPLSSVVLVRRLPSRLSCKKFAMLSVSRCLMISSIVGKALLPVRSNAWIKAMPLLKPAK